MSPEISQLKTLWPGFPMKEATDNGFPTITVIFKCFNHPREIGDECDHHRTASTCQSKKSWLRTVPWTGLFGRSLHQEIVGFKLGRDWSTSVIANKLAAPGLLSNSVAFRGSDWGGKGYPNGGTLFN